MQFLGKLTLRWKLIILFLTLGLVPMALVAFFNFEEAHHKLEDLTAYQLVCLNKDRKSQIQDFFRHLRRDMEVLSDHRLLKDMLIKYVGAYQEGGLEGEAFRAVDSRYYRRVVELNEKYGFEDMLFVNTDGEVIITVRKNPEWGTNLLKGPYSDTNLARCFRGGLTGISIVDFEKYPPSGKPAAFIGAPIITHMARPPLKLGELMGALIIRIPVDQINTIMQRKTGLGKTGETYLVPDRKVRIV